MARFTAAVDEPRPGLLRGHIPGSCNVPFEDTLTSAAADADNAGGSVHVARSPDEMRALFARAGVEVANNERPVIVTCGSGMTACVLIWSMRAVLGRRENIYLYDGSWSEWYAPLDVKRLPIRSQIFDSFFQGSSGS